MCPNRPVIQHNLEEQIEKLTGKSSVCFVVGYQCGADKKQVIILLDNTRQQHSLQ